MFHLNLQDQINRWSRIVVEVSVVKLEVEMPHRDTVTVASCPSILKAIYRVIIILNMNSSYGT